MVEWTGPRFNEPVKCDALIKPVDGTGTAIPPQELYVDPTRVIELTIC